MILNRSYASDQSGMGKMLGLNWIHLPFDTLMVFLKEFFEKVFENNKQMTKSRKTTGIFLPFLSQDQGPAKFEKKAF